MELSFLLLTLLSGVVTLLSISRSKSGNFYSDTPWLLPLGIFVWGDGLILGPFWIIASIWFVFLNSIEIIRFLLLFFAIRSLYEVIYWLTHQFSSKSYQAPLFRKVRWLSPNDSAILYQLVNMCVVVMTLFGLVYSLR